MSQVLTIAKKELRSYFVSPVALIFLGTFLFVVLFSFFWVDTFFRRNIADLRPLFHWLPILLIFLVGALTMRLWSEEQRAGTLEILLTLPIKTHRLVLGKFLGGLGLVAVALLLTSGLPLTVSMLGELDWGPVLGGYLAALLLASAYLAIGLCVSSSTDNPIVALIITCLACGLLYLIGSESVAAFAGNRATEVLQSIGIGSRFESIRRGVIDLRDLVYYGSLCGGFLFLNVAILEAKRWSTGKGTRGRRSATKLSVLLVVVNLLLLNVGLAQVHRARVDLTERNEYSISPVTEKLLVGLDAPLLIRGYFSAKTHPLLAPLVPRIRDLIEEYGAIGGDRVRTEFIDPREQPALEKEANEAYGIKSVPFQFADRHEAAVVNSYFTVLVKYGDKYEKLSFADLIEVNVSGLNDIEVRLRNLEYDLTRTIKKVVYGFQPLESVFARVAGKVKLTAYVTPSSLPDNFKALPGLIEKVAQEIAKRSGGKFALETVDPSDAGKEGLQRELYEKYGFKPLAASLFSEQAFYLHLLVQAGDKHDRVYPTPEMSEGGLRSEIVASIKRVLPGFLKTVGLLAPAPQQPPPNPMMGRRPPPPDHFQLLRARLADGYTVKNVDLKDGRVPGDVDVLLVIGPKQLDDKQRFAIDQYLMRGGAVVLAAGKYAMEASRGGGLGVTKVDSELESLLESWGIKLLPKMVLDAQNQPFPVPVERDVMGMRVQELQMLPYPYWVDVRADGMAKDSPIVGGLPSVTLQWASPLELAHKQGLEHTALLHSSDKSWLQQSTEVQPDFDKYPEKGFDYPTGGKGDQATKRRVLAVAATGTFSSAFANKPSPLFKAEGDKKPAKGKTAGRTILRSPKDARLVVVGSSEFLNDQVLRISQQAGSDRYTTNLQLLQNMIDWSVADVDLLSIRARGAYARTLAPLDESARTSWELSNYAVVLVLLGLVVGVAFVRRRKLQPMPLTRDDRTEA